MKINCSRRTGFSHMSKIGVTCRCSVSFRQKVHFSLSMNPNLSKKLLKLNLVYFILPYRLPKYLTKAMCSFANWYMLLKGQRSNLAILTTLRDDSDPETRKLFGKLLKDSETVRNTDRIAVDPILDLTADSFGSRNQQNRTKVLFHYSMLMFPSTGLLCLLLVFSK